MKGKSPAFRLAFLDVFPSRPDFDFEAGALDLALGLNLQVFLRVASLRFGLAPKLTYLGLGGPRRPRMPLRCRLGALVGFQDLLLLQGGAGTLRVLDVSLDPAHRQTLGAGALTGTLRAMSASWVAALRASASADWAFWRSRRFAAR